MDSTTEAPSGYATGDTDWAAVAPRANFLSRAYILEMCVRASLRIPGDIVEFGVATGASTRVIRHTLHRYGRPWFVPYGRKRIYALDSFEGLREAFENVGVGHFAGPVPRIPGVRFVEGYFEGTCTPALRAEIGRVAFAHLDADLYSSTLFALTWLTPMLSTGSLLLFDQFTGGGFAERNAFVRWQEETGTSVMRVAEFDREPSGNGTRQDRRLLFQVVATDTLPPRQDKSRAMWKLAYYLGRLGMHDLRARIENRM